jgi:hypothetical protein
MIIDLAKRSAVEDGTMCMKPERFNGQCFRCDAVMRCPNVQAKNGRVLRLNNIKSKLQSRIDIIEMMLDEESSPD